MKTNLYAIAKQTQHVGTKIWLTQGKQYRVHKILSRSSSASHIIIVDDNGDLTTWSKDLFTYKEA